MATNKISYKSIVIFGLLVITAIALYVVVRPKSDDSFLPPSEEPNSQAFWKSDFFSDYTLNYREDIQKFLDTQTGDFKNYKEERKDKYSSDIEIRTGAHIIENASQQYIYDINSRVLMTILELRWHLITDKNASIDQVRRDLFVLLSEVNDEYANVERYEDRTLLLYLIDFGYVLQKSYEEYPERDVLQFQDGVVLKIDPAIHAGEYAVQKTLALLAKDYAEWEEWMGDGYNSFYQTYKRLFGDPNGN